MRVHKKKAGIAAIIFLSVAFLFFQSATTPDKQTVSSVLNYYRSQTDSLKAAVLLLESEAATASPERLQFLFEKGRYHYKKAEAIIEYHFPATATRLNGAPLPETEPSEPNEPKHPKGFQVLEELIYAVPDANTRRDIRYETSSIINATNKLEVLLPGIRLSEGNILDALRLNLYRMIIKGITGFDNPVGFKGVNEAEATLISTQKTLSFFPGSGKVQEACEKAIAFIRSSGYNFDAFDRAVFIREYMNPLCISLYNFREAEDIPLVQQSKALSAKARYLFEKNAFDLMYFAPDGTPALTAEQVALGKKLFYDPAFSISGKRSCGSCHQPEKAFTDGLKVNESLLGGEKLLRNTPTLINAGLQPAQFYDSRIAFLEDQAHDVISNRSEMGGTIELIVDNLNKNKAYKKLFREAYPGKKIDGDHMKKALAAYIRSLTAMNSPFDRYMQGDASAMSPEQIRGFNLYAGKAKCATCHFMPLFSGAVPPLYHKMESEILGVPANSDTLHAVLDTDSGKYKLYGIPHQLYAFKTTTLRNTAVTAPYMHNGVFNTLEEVIDFYNRAGGTGLGFDLPNQTLPEDRLNLSVEEKKALIAFLHALTDTATQY
jgi:cytochrome c peroxidase